MLTVIVVLVLATAFGLWRRAVDGRMRDVAAEGTDGSGAVRTVPDQSWGAVAGGHGPAERIGAGGRVGPLRPDPPPAWTGPAGGAAGPPAHHGEPGYLDAEDLGGPLGPRATLVQFSSAFCQPCRATRRVLGEVAELVPGVVHVEIDAEQHLDLVRRLHVLRTPTVLVLDGAGRVRKRASGQPRKADVIAALGAFLTTSPLEKP